MSHFFKFILDVYLKLDDAICEGGIFNLLSNFRSFSVKASFEQALGMIQLVLAHVGEEFGELVIHVSCIAIVLDVEITVS